MAKKEPTWDDFNPYEGVNLDSQKIDATLNPLYGIDEGKWYRNVGRFALNLIPGLGQASNAAIANAQVDERFKKQSENFMAHIDTIAERTQKKGEKLSEGELEAILGDKGHWASDDLYDTIYDNFISQYYDELFSEDAQAANNARAATSQIKALQDAFSSMEPQAITQQLNAQGLNADYQSYLDALNMVSDQQYQIAMDELAMEENQLYRSIGLSQRQMERDIAKRRQQALKSGMSTAQLAAQEQQNILAAQTGAAQIAQQYADQRYSTINEFAGASAQNYANVLAQQMQYNQNLEQFNAQQSANWASTLAQVYPQYYAADQYKNQS